jgi:predicted O-methyltransferase YrrM
LLPLPVHSQYADYSAVFSALDDACQPSADLISLALEAVGHARKCCLTNMGPGQNDPALNLWPGEHYRLLAGLVLASQPRLVIEVGTGLGLSALSMKRFLPPTGKIITFDLLDWRSFGTPGQKGWMALTSYLQDEDFADGRLVQHVGDLSDQAVFARYRTLLEDADLIFIDAAHRGAEEQQLLGHLQMVDFKRRPLVVLDDIRLWHMLAVWRQIPYPKLDLTSLGHWSGTGLVAWKAGTVPERGS